MLRSHLLGFWHDESGATAIEYGLIAGILGIGIIVGLTQVKDGIYGLWQKISNGLNS